MQNNFTLPLVITLRASTRCKIWTVLLHLGAACMLGLTALPWWLKFLLLLAIGCSYRDIMARHCRRSHPASITQILCNDADEWWLTAADGKTTQVSLVFPVFVHASLVILVFRHGRFWWQRRAVILTADMADADTLRRLRVRLRFPQAGNMAADAGET